VNCVVAADQYIYSASDDKTVIIWEKGSSEGYAPKVVLQGHTNWVNALAVEPVGASTAPTRALPQSSQESKGPQRRWLFSGSQDGTVRSWDAQVSIHIFKLC
jgi:WD40 repeat protein